MKKTIEATDNKNYKLNEIADFILKELDVDVRLNTKSKKYNLPDYRAFFFALSLEHIDICYALLGGFLGKDHSTVTHAIKKWDDLLYKKYGHLFIKYEPYFVSAPKRKKGEGNKSARKKEIKQNRRIIELELQFQQSNREYQKKIEKLNVEISKYKKKINNEHLSNLLLKDDETINFFSNTRIQPFLKMLESKVTYSDIIKNKPKSRYDI